MPSYPGPRYWGLRCEGRPESVGREVEDGRGVLGLSDGALDNLEAGTSLPANHGPWYYAPRSHQELLLPAGAALLECLLHHGHLQDRLHPPPDVPEEEGESMNRHKL